MSNDLILKKINSLLNMTMENGASENEANTALEMAQRLMAQHMIDESQLAEHAKDKTCKKISVPIFKTAYDTTPINDAIASTFDCKCWWNTGKGEVYFFGYGEDANLSAYFYNYLNNALVNEGEKYKRTIAFTNQKVKGLHTRTIMASFRKGMMIRLIARLEEVKESRVSNVLKSTGTNLVLVKEDKVLQEYDALGLKLKTHKTSWEIASRGAYASGKDAADGVNMAGGISGKGGYAAAIGEE